MRFASARKPESVGSTATAGEFWARSTERSVAVTGTFGSTRRRGAAAATPGPIRLTKQASTDQAARGGRRRGAQRPWYDRDAATSGACREDARLPGADRARRGTHNRSSGHPGPVHAGYHVTVKLVSVEASAIGVPVVADRKSTRLNS